MSKHETTVTISAENMATLKEKYSIDKAGLEDILENVEVEAPIQASAKPTKLPNGDVSSSKSQLIRQITSGKTSMADAIIYISEMARIDREERRIKLEEAEAKGKKEHNSPGLTAEAIGIEVRGALENIGIGKGGNNPEEEPDWVTEIRKENQSILERFRKEDDIKERQKMIDEATGPFKAELEKMQEKVADLSKPTPAGSGPPKSDLQAYIDGQKALKTAGILLEHKSNVLIGPGGQQIPVKGEIPVLVAYGPQLFEQLLGSLEKTLDNVGKKWGFFGEEAPAGIPKKPEEPLIKMPKKPEPEVKPVEPIMEAPAEEVTTTEPEAPTESIIDMPKKPTEEDVVTEEPVEDESIPVIWEVPCAQCGVKKELLPSGICKPCVTEIAKKPKEPKKVKKTKMTKKPKKKEKKTVEQTTSNS